MTQIPYRSLLERLLFLSTRTRHDISTATSLLGKYAYDPKPTRWRALKSVLRYLYGTSTFGLPLQKQHKPILQAWCDADCARDLQKRSSCSGYVIMLGTTSIVWASKLQSAVALSTVEAEFFALSQHVREVRWILDLLAEVRLPCQKPTTIYQDNLRTIPWTGEVEGLRNVKYVGIRYHFVKEAVQQREINVKYVLSAGSVADILTKALISECFKKHRATLQLFAAPLQGGCQRATYGAVTPDTHTNQR